ncbi:hypothetical protein PoB_002946200 [Plakobranchus ocellatus]|uniref:AGC-kinase C-terminal domain-containing protein n=1 Tax=Plakobranchus ocellatus TaxID=259542 RepID=A0AAV4A7Q9_9GAST|nr:hypothetical protein PoB_002946200 [Plakobranchus ocellatus]
MLKTDGGGPAEPMDKMSEGISDLLPNQFAAVENEFDEDYILEKGVHQYNRMRLQPSQQHLRHRHRLRHHPFFF